jgi:hypothetical protein
MFGAAMFWVIFDTSTKRDYYRDVHNILALPPGATIRYDYGEKDMSTAAVDAAKRAGIAGNPVLLAYAQTKTFKKGDADPKGAIPVAGGFWTPTRLAVLKHVQVADGRCYFDLEMAGYPAPDEASFAAIAQDLAARNEVPFEKWIAICDRDPDYAALRVGELAANWAAVVDRLGNFPSQFAGDTFWRLAQVATGSERAAIAPVFEAAPAASGVGQGVQAFFPVNELVAIGLQIQSRMPETGQEPAGKEAASARKVRFEATATGPLGAFNGRELDIRRYAYDWIDAEIAGSDRIDAQSCEMKLRTGPESGSYPIGPELSLKFQVSKTGWRGYWATITAILAVVVLAVGGALLKDNLAVGIILLVVGTFLGILALYFWTGRVRLPGSK